MARRKPQSQEEVDAIIAEYEGDLGPKIKRIYRVRPYRGSLNPRSIKRARKTIQDLYELTNALRRQVVVSIVRARMAESALAATTHQFEIKAQING